MASHKLTFTGLPACSDEYELTDLGARMSKEIAEGKHLIPGNYFKLLLSIMAVQQKAADKGADYIEYQDVVEEAEKEQGMLFAHWYEGSKKQKPAADEPQGATLFPVPQTPTTSSLKRERPTVDHWVYTDGAVVKRAYLRSQHYFILEGVKNGEYLYSEFTSEYTRAGFVTLFDKKKADVAGVLYDSIVNHSEAGKMGDHFESLSDAQERMYTKAWVALEFLPWRPAEYDSKKKGEGKREGQDWSALKGLRGARKKQGRKRSKK